MIVRLKKKLILFFNPITALCLLRTINFGLVPIIILKDQNYMLTEFEKINQINFLDQITKGVLSWKLIYLALDQPHVIEDRSSVN